MLSWGATGCCVHWNHREEEGGGESVGMAFSNGIQFVVELKVPPPSPPPQKKIDIDLRVIVSFPNLLQLVSDLMWDLVSGLDWDLACGVPYTGKRKTKNENRDFGKKQGAQPLIFFSWALA